MSTYKSLLSTIFLFRDQRFEIRGFITPAMGPPFGFSYNLNQCEVAYSPPRESHPTHNVTNLLGHVLVKVKNFRSFVFESFADTHESYQNLQDNLC